MTVQTTSKALLEPVLDQGVLNTNFFNGRLLTAADLKTEQIANHEQHRQLGQAIGEGVARGMEVRLVADGSMGGAPIVSVSSGLAVSRQGQAIALPVDVQVALARQSQPPVGAGLFADCAPPQSGPSSTGKGVYILIVSPASAFREQAPMVGLAGNGNATGCGSRYVVEGVQFRLEELTSSMIAGISPATSSALPDPSSSIAPAASTLRNLLAYLCFGTEKLASFQQDPFRRANGQSAFATYGALDALRLAGNLTDCDVPLALVYWTAAGVQFVDMWSVRRQIARTSPTGWPLFVGERRPRESQAMFLQFEDQIEELRAKETSLGSIVATSRFAYLPPAGLLPVTGTDSPSGFDPQTFFGTRASRDVALTDGAQLRSLMHEALYHEPIDLSGSDRIQLYLIFENVQAVAQHETAQLALVFASHTLPYRGVARFGYAKWSLSRIAPATI